MQEAKNGVLQGNLPALCYCFLSCTILTLQRRVAMTRMRIDLEGDAFNRPLGHPSCGKDQLPNSERKISQINLVLVKHKTKVSEA
jgi:hypothetical protein